MDNPTAIGSMYGIFSYIWLFLMMKYGFHVGKYTSPMDPVGQYRRFSFQTLAPRRTFKKVDLDIAFELSGCFKNPTLGPQQPMEK